MGVVVVHKIKIKKCAVCGVTDHLLRCSRCKNSWYCGAKHQREHWSTHQKFCKPHKKKPILPDINKQGIGDDDIIMGESRVSLRCPLTIKRIATPIRGVNCKHPQCFDLLGYLGYCHTTGKWECPVCRNSCAFDDIAIDEKMQDILNETSKEIDQVRCYPDGTFKAITLEEIKKENSCVGRKRARPETVDLSSPVKKQKKIKPTETKNNETENITQYTTDNNNNSN